MKIDVVKNLNGWRPANEKAESYHKKFKLGDIYSLEFKHYRDQRNKALLDKYWVMLGKVVDNHSKYRDSKDLHHDIKWALDLVEHRQDIRTGENYRIVKSIAMDKMNQDTFERYYFDAVNVILQFILPGIDKEDLEIEIAVDFG